MYNSLSKDEKAFADKYLVTLLEPLQGNTEIMVDSLSNKN